MTTTIKLDYGVTVGGGHDCLIILDAGVNHNNDLQRAKELVRTAKEGGAQSIKFQTYSAGEISTRTAPRYWDSKLDSDGGVSQYDMFKKVDDLPKRAYHELKRYARSLKILFSSSPFGMPSARFLAELGIDFFKIASAEITNHEMIEYVAKTGKPVILSGGACTVGEIEKAIQVIRRTGNDKIAVQHCVLSYPCKHEDANLAKMVRLQQIFPDIPVGYSDHTYGNDVPLAAIALGASTIEKHYTLSSDLPDSPDHKFALTAAELKGFVTSCKRTQSAIGTYCNGYYPAEEKAFKFARKSIVAVVPIKKGAKITKNMISFKRPGTGIYPEFAQFLIGRTAVRDIKEDQILQWDMV